MEEGKAYIIIITSLLLLINFPGTDQQFPTPFNEVETTAVANLSQNIEVACGFGENLGPVLWVINGTVYDLNTDVFPCFIRDSRYTIRIETVLLCYDDTTFQCISSIIHPPGRVTRLNVIENPLSTGNNSYDCMNCINEQPSTSTQGFTSTRDELEIDTKTLTIYDNNVTTFEFLHPNPCTSSTFHLQVLNGTDSSLVRSIPITCCSVNISSYDILSNDNAQYVLRIINSGECSPNTSSYISIYNRVTNQSIINVDEAACISIPPSIKDCGINNLQNLVISSDCYFPLLYFDGNYESYQGCMTFNSYRVQVNLSQELVCFYDWDFEFTSTVVHFMCTVQEDANDLLVYNYFASHQFTAENQSFINSTSSTFHTTDVTRLISTTTDIDTATTTIVTTSSSNQNISPIILAIAIIGGTTVHIIIFLCFLSVAGLPTIYYYLKKRGGTDISSDYKK